MCGFYGLRTFVWSGRKRKAIKIFLYWSISPISTFALVPLLDDVKAYLTRYKWVFFLVPSLLFKVSLPEKYILWINLTLYDIILWRKLFDNFYVQANYSWHHVNPYEKFPHCTLYGWNVIRRPPFQQILLLLRFIFNFKLKLKFNKCFNFLIKTWRWIKS